MKKPLINRGRTVEDIAREHFTRLYVEDQRKAEQERRIVRKAQIRKEIEQGSKYKLYLKNSKDILEEYVATKISSGRDFDHDKFVIRYGVSSQASAALKKTGDLFKTK